MLDCYPETDSLYIESTSAPGSQAERLLEGLMVDLDADGNVFASISTTRHAISILSKGETIALRSASQPK